MTTEDLIFNGLALFVFFLICVAITRAIFSISSFLKYQKAQTLLLAKIARAQGVAHEEIKICFEVINPDSAKLASFDNFQLDKLDQLHAEPKTA